MNYYNVIGLLNTSMSAIFCASLFVLWRHHNQFKYIAILGISYAIRSLCFGFFYFAFVLENPVLRLLANALLMMSMLFLSIGLSNRRGQQPRYGALLTISAIALGALYYNQFIEPSLLARVMTFNFALAAVGVLMLLDVARHSDRTPVEQVLLGLIVVSCAGFLLRPLFLLASGLPNEQFEGAYWLVVSISDALICAMTAVGIFAVIASDVMDGIKSDAQIDVLSGLFNRRGFEPRALDTLARQSSAAPVAMILGDLDHFKSINDRFGHSGGDRIIQRFSDVLKEKALRDAIVARLGGEEFAILLPPGKAGTAYLFADDVRSTFKEVATGIVSGEASPTVSIGIAIAREEEDLHALMERADRALYKAKNDGRDCVRLDE
ncbi:GGDEF domain-containing protein [Shinella sp.]|uniref:GGDEF domain-containing protein n=1 Tax=Shinella sp. TaxID=1870904 RepID=UPI0029AE16E0|nr:GGDEF domain-containing protein [Shinella sp.]MDX3978103.1 GGDEF domain-containing protein [Shinella sp.]